MAKPKKATPMPTPGKGKPAGTKKPSQGTFPTVRGKAKKGMSKGC